MANTNEQNQEEEMQDMEVAELAGKLLKEKENENAQLRKELAKMKLLSKEPEEEEPERLSKEDCIKILNDTRTTNYDYAKACVDLSHIEVEAGNPHPMGTDGEEVCKFFEECIEACNGDKSRFPSVYQSKIGADDKEVALAYNKRKNF